MYQVVRKRFIVNKVVRNALLLEELSNRVRDARDRLSPAQREVVTHLMKRPQDFAFLPLRQVAGRVGVSTATVVRTAQVLGFSGYGAMQEEIQKALWSSRFTSRLAAAESDDSPTPGSATLAGLMEDDIEAIRSTLGRVDPVAVDTAVQLLAGARRVYVLGQRMSSGPAEFFSRVFGTLMGKVHLLGREPGMLFDSVVDPSEEDVLVVIAFQRYTASTVAFTQMAKNRGIPIIAVTDSPLSPLVGFSTCSFYVASASGGPVDTYVAAVSLLNALAGLVALRNLSSVRRRLADLDGVLNESGTFYTVE